MTTTAGQPSASEEVLKLVRRNRIIEEIFDSEETYVLCMRTLRPGYYTPLLTSAFVSEDDRETIFQGVFDVINITEAFYANLAGYHDTLQLDQHIGKCFRDFIPFLRVYKAYIGNNETCLNVLATIEKDQRVVDFLEQCHQEITSRFKHSLRSLLIMPVQRIPRYVLLLKDLLAHTDETHPEFQTLTQSLLDIQTLAANVNQAIAETERRHKLMTIRDHVKGYNGEIAISSRFIIREGLLMKVCRKTSKPRYFYLFNDILLYGNERLGIVTVSDQGVLPVDNMVLTDLPDNATRKFAFQLQSTNRSFMVFADSQKDKDDWIKAIDTAVTASNGTIKAKTRAAHQTVLRPVFKPDAEAPCCETCNAEFTFVRRRHHCRACGRCICGECSKGRIPLPPDNSFERVCVVCFEAYATRGQQPSQTDPQEKPENDPNFKTRSVVEQLIMTNQISETDESLKTTKKTARPASSLVSPLSRIPETPSAPPPTPSKPQPPQRPPPEPPRNRLNNPLNQHVGSKSMVVLPSKDFSQNTSLASPRLMDAIRDDYFVGQAEMTTGEADGATTPHDSSLPN